MRGREGVLIEESGGHKRRVQVHLYVFSLCCRSAHMLFGSNANPSPIHMRCRRRRQKTRMKRRCLPVSLSVLRLENCSLFPRPLIAHFPLCPPRGVFGRPCRRASGGACVSMSGEYCKLSYNLYTNTCKLIRDLIKLVMI